MAAQLDELRRRRAGNALALAEDLAFEPGVIRLAHLLGRAARDGEPQVDVGTREELGARVDLSREEATKALHRLAARDLVRGGGRGWILVPDAAALLALRARDLGAEPMPGDDQTR